MSLSRREPSRPRPPVPARYRKTSRSHVESGIFHVVVQFAELEGAGKYQVAFCRLLDESLGKHSESIRIVLLGHLAGEVGACPGFTSCFAKQVS